MCINHKGGTRIGGSRVTALAPHLLGVQMEQHASHPNEKAKEESNAVPLCRAKPSPSFINLQASSPPATFLNIQRTKLPSGVEHKPKECLGLLECMYANLQLQTQLAQQQMAILENLQASMTQLAPGRGSKKSSLPVLSRNLLLNHLSQFSK
ncbi:TSSK6-activating co-chaperone protein isoform X1 [Canis lupus baileyi]|uniref:TSSK6-activating co-chaperone protein isoform X2 n=1 Tax=Canis lupus familiaris TaxID=9615 RepID=UPI0006B3CBE2|nr:TSSK6-activating co-chaperone protein isoform X2 [Canis lupus familiaris]XP_038398951.1 TSSK6-activating co-chaperone protein isoform X2 [Canis lupus familiaris]XP_038527788.1 TSSK6-activating co-chaperone protein isoform X2 [Canis lupus familiaris]|eukprot:XP_013970785.1 TSSK6-activating co-chaperone protein isoform X2 [Canis lupus familiaris]